MWVNEITTNEITTYYLLGVPEEIIQYVTILSDYMMGPNRV